MDKSPEAFRTISEVASALDVPPHVLRFWETRFSQVKPVKRGGGRRYYRPEDISLLRGIKDLLYTEGLTIKGVQKVLRDRGVRHVVDLGTIPEDQTETAAAAPAKPPPAKKPTRSPKVENGVDAKPAAEPAETSTQADLFPEPDTAQIDIATVGGKKPIDKTALKALLSELEALRAVMLSDHRR